jgi:iron complex outermembrane receptor protein
MTCLRRAPSAPRRHALAVAVLAAAGSAAHAQPPSLDTSPPAPAAAPAPAAPASSPDGRPVVPALPRVEVVGTTPVPGVGLPRDRIPANVQVLNLQRLREQDALNLPELMSRSLGSVNTAEIQGNPYQVEVNFRGFSASPLLGTPQGISVFVDGVRVNEPFGDIVNWDLVPRNALRSIVLMPGSNPVFGLNTLGGALVLTTKSGATDPGTEVELGGGAWNRVSAEVSHGARLDDGAHLFVAAGATREDGWRDESPSRVEQFFGKYGRRDGRLDWDLSLTLANNRLVGNGVLPDTMLAQNYEQVYTIPDETRNRLATLAFNAAWELNETDQLSGTAYLRSLDVKTLNGDVNDEFDPPAVTESGVENRTQTGQRSRGLALQWSRTQAEDQLVVGTTYDDARSDFVQTEAEGELDGSRRVVPTEEEEVNARLDGRTRTASLYVANTMALQPDVHLSLAGRYNHTRVTTVDVGRAELGLDTALDNDLAFKRFNPAVGLTWQARPTLTAYGSLSQGNRAPSPIELGCSDPANACVLPNALQSDPPLNQVVSRTVEAGLRGVLEGLPGGGNVRWNASLFRTQNRDDILFVSNSLAAGFFTNFGKTLRQGLELGASGRSGAFDWALNYSRVRATFESGACLVAESNSTAETSANCTGDDEIEVLPGDRLPGIPLDTLKLDAGWRPWPGLRIAAGMVAQSSVFVRGNENNRHEPDGAEFFGSGRVAGFGVLNLSAAWQFAPGWTLTGKVANVFDRKYGTGGVLAENSFDANGVLQAPADWVNERFTAPGAPRAAWVGVRYSFGGGGE